MIPLLAIVALTGAAPKKLPQPGYISPTVRKLIDERMEHHGEAAMRLSLSVVLLDYGDVWEVAQSMIEQPGIARPRAGEDQTLNNTLPARFFELQTELRNHAKDLQAAAKRKNAAEMSSAYGKVVQTCVTCHAVYLNGPGSEAAKKETLKDLGSP